MTSTPPLEYARPEPRKPSGLRLIHYLLIAGILALLVSVILPQQHGNPRVVKQVSCAANLRQIDQGIALYTEHYQGLFPPDLLILAGTEPLGLSAMVCPASKDREPQAANALGNPGTCSYIYVGTGFTAMVDPNCIVALEDPANHELRGGNVLFGDGHVEFLDLPTIQQILNELNAGRNPPATLIPTLSQAGAEQDYQQRWQPRMPQLKTGVWRIPTTRPTTNPEPRGTFASTRPGAHK